MALRKKYPKSFYDDGLGDILEWIDDEVLVSAEAKREKTDKKAHKRKSQVDSDIEQKGSDKKPKYDKAKQVKIYGDNDLEKVRNRKNKLESQINNYDADDDLEPHTLIVDKKIETRTRGLLNRLAAQTMPYISEEFVKLYSTQSRTEINNALFNNIQGSLINQEAVTKRKLVAEFMLLISYLDNKIDHNIGATIVHMLFKQFHTLYSSGSGDQDKRLDNVIFCLVNLYMIGLLSGNVIFELAKRICSPEDFRSKSVELLLIILKNIGFQLRKDNPSLMRQLILMSHEQCKQFRNSEELDSRIEFIMEALGAIKNNNVSKIGNYGCDIDKDTIESTLKGLLKRTRLPEALNDATYGDICNSCNWYLLEIKAEEFKADDGLEKDDKRIKSQVGNKTELKICKALGLNKPAERTIFGALIKVTDHIEASNIIIGFGLNHCSDSMVVVIHVAIYEKKYNPFYYDVINSLCKFNRKYKMAAKFAIQDKIRALGGMPSQRVDILAKLTLELIKSDAVPITVLKSIEWANLCDSTKQYLVYLLESISALPEEERRKIMVKSDRKSSFAGAMRTFSSCFLEGCNLFD